MHNVNFFLGERVPPDSWGEHRLPGFEHRLPEAKHMLQFFELSSHPKVQVFFRTVGSSRLERTSPWLKLRLQGEMRVDLARIVGRKVSSTLDSISLTLTSL